MKFLQATLVAAFLAVASPALSQQTTETVITIGMGSSIEAAIQNAARNALTQAVGQFVDAETQITKRTEIRDGVREITKDMSENISATSNGTIQEVKILDQQNNDGIFQVEAAVTVRISDLERALEGKLTAEANVSNVFAQVAATNNVNFDEKTKIFSKLLSEMLSADYVTIEAGDPQTFQSYMDENNIDNLEGRAGGYLSFLQGKYNNVVDDLIDLYAREGYTLLVVPVDIGYTESAIASWKSTLTELAANSIVYPWENSDKTLSYFYQNQGNLRSWRDQIKPKLKSGELPVCFVKLNTGNSCYVIPAFGSKSVEEHLGPLFKEWLNDTRFSPHPLRQHELTVSVLDKDGFPVAKGNIISTSSGDYTVSSMSMNLQGNGFAFQFADFPGEAFPMTPGSGLIASGGGFRNIHLVEKKRIHVGLILTADKLSRAASISAEITPGAIDKKR
jgi:hypothetical protein